MEFDQAAAFKELVLSLLHMVIRWTIKLGRININEENSKYSKLLIKLYTNDTECI